MKQMLFFVLVFSALISAASALSADMRESYNQGETMVIEILGLVLQPIQPSQVEFLRGHVPVVFEYDIKRLGNRYFIYAITPFLTNNYTLVVNDIETMLNGQTAQQDLRQNFSTTNQTAPYTLRPGFISAGNDFSLSAALNRDQPENIIVSAGNRSVTLNPGANTLNFAIADFKYGFQTLSIGSYQIPVFSTYVSSNITQPPRPALIEINPLRIEEIFIRDKGKKIITFIIRNTADRELKNFEFEYDKDKYEITPSRLKKLKINATSSFNLTFANEADVLDTIRITADEEVFEIPVAVSFVDELPWNINSTNSNSTLPRTNRSLGYSCAELNGKICSASQQCSGETISSREGNCCRGTCVEAKKESSLAWLGYIVGMLALLIAIIVGSRYLKARAKARKENPLDKRVKKLERPF